MPSFETHRASVFASSRVRPSACKIPARLRLVWRKEIGTSEPYQCLAALYVRVDTKKIAQGDQPSCGVHGAQSYDATPAGYADICKGGDGRQPASGFTYVCKSCLPVPPRSR